MSAEIRSFSDSLESIIYWDASFVIASQIDTETFHVECDAFRRRLDTEGILSVASDFLYNEIIFVTVKNALIIEGRHRGQSWRQVYEANPEFITGVMPEVRRKIADIETATLQLSIPLTVKDRVLQLMEDYGLLPTDAYHLAIGLESGVTAFVSLDTDLLRVDGLIVYTCVPSDK